MADNEYLTVAAAEAAVLAEVTVLGGEKVALLAALGRILAEDVVAEEQLPPFPNSAMDGYAVRAEDVVGVEADNGRSLRVVADIAAGSWPEVAVTPGTAARIMTGAPLPPGADAIVPVEGTNEPWRASERPLPEQIEIYQEVGSGDYVRPAGQDIAKGMKVMGVGHRLRPQEIGVLAALGVAKVAVVRRPRVGILATGDELVGVEEALTPGKIRNSNGYAQAAQVLALGAEPVMLGVAGDTEASVRACLAQGVAEGVDLLVSSAGVSVGAYDVVKAVLAAEGEVGFWRVRMRPGKPLAFGRYQGILYLGLPGNPVSAQLSFERFVRPAIRKMGGYRAWQRPLVPVIVREDIGSDGRESYLRAVIERGEEGYEARLTGHQGSNLMSSMVKANGLVIIPEGVTEVKAGTSLQGMMIDWPEFVF
ncbi:MAG TPA: gephyrin-like molybdotransferase Glp [Anaerolineae bacterium]|nr:gephyrin-like molybdotransferase Glp [Anaerolineae bacterium]